MFTTVKKSHSLACCLLVFPEVVRRIASRPDLNDVETINVTLFQVCGFVNDVDGDYDDFGKILEKLAHESKLDSKLNFLHLKFCNFYKTFLKYFQSGRKF